MQARRILNKLFYMLVTILCVLIFNFVLFRLLPGDIITRLDRTTKASAEALKNLAAYYGLDGTLWQQFVGYFGKLARLDLGTSYAYGKSVWSVIASRILPTVMLLGISEIIAIVLGTLFGVVAAAKRGRAIDTGLLSFSLVVYSMPTFWLCMMLILVFCTKLGWFPSMGMYTTGRIFASTWAYIRDVSHHMVLPIICMGLGMTGEYCVTMRSTMMDVLSEDYITTARAKGFRERYVLLRHAMPNAMLPMVTLVFMNLGFVIAGAVQLETMFAWPGLGSLTYAAIDNRDYTLLQGIFLFTTISTILANFIADVVYGLIDPRIKN